MITIPITIDKFTSIVRVWYSINEVTPKMGKLSWEDMLYQYEQIKLTPVIVKAKNNYDNEIESFTLSCETPEVLTAFLLKYSP